MGGGGVINNIGYVDETWNPIIGCSHCSVGCENCYAERFAMRLGRNPRTPQYAGLTEHARWTGNVRFCPEELDKPLRWWKPRRILVCSMGDICHPNVQREWVDAITNVISCCPQHQFLLLTKRPENILEQLHNDCMELDNIWLGVTVCNQAEADKNIPILLQIPAARRWVSVEPCLEDIQFPNLLGISFIVCGAETGPGARPMNPKWELLIRQQCRDAGVAYWLKGWDRRDISIDGNLQHLPEGMG